MLSHLHIRRIRSVFSESLPLGPLTLLVGENGSGKSNIIRAIFLSSKLSRRLIASRPAGCDKDERLYGEALDPAEIYAYSRVPEVKVELTLSTWPTAGRSYGLLGEPYRTQGSIRIDYFPEVSRPYVRYRITPNLVRTADKLLEVIAGIRYISTDRLIRWDIETQSIDMEERELLTGHELLRSLQHISRSQAKSRILADIGRTLFKVNWESLVERPKDMKYVDAAIGPSGVTLPFYLGSLGTRQFFPILVHSLAMNRGGILITEEPEISLHPGAQVAVGEYLADVAHRGVQMIVTTHSHYLLLGVCKQVRAGVIPPEQVVILNCEKTAYGTKVRRLELNEHGRIDGWIPSFSDVDDYLFEDWVTSIPEA